MKSSMKVVEVVDDGASVGLVVGEGTSPLVLGQLEWGMKVSLC